MVLCWGAVVTFLTLPFVTFLLHVVSDEFPTSFHFSQHLQEYKFLVPYYQSITGLVFALAGLNSWDKRINGFAKGSEAADKDAVKITETPKGKTEEVRIDITK
jgi:hypothetical protein